MIKVSVLLADGFEEIEALTAVDLLRRARIYVDTISITDDYTVHGAHGINVQTEDLFDEVDFSESDMIVLPGGMPGTLNEEASPVVQAAIDYCVAKFKRACGSREGCKRTYASRKIRGRDLCCSYGIGRSWIIKRKEDHLLSYSGTGDSGSSSSPHTCGSRWKYCYRKRCRNSSRICA